MSREATIVDALRGILSRDFEVDPNALTLDARLKDIAIDSLAVIEIMFAVEDEFHITVPPEPPEARQAIDTVGDLVRYIDRLIAEQRDGEAQGEASA